MKMQIKTSCNENSCNVEGLTWCPQNSPKTSKGPLVIGVEVQCQSVSARGECWRYGITTITFALFSVADGQIVFSTVRVMFDLSAFVVFSSKYNGKQAVTLKEAKVTVTLSQGLLAINVQEHRRLFTLDGLVITFTSELPI